LDPSDSGRFEPGLAAGDPGRFEPGRFEPGRFEPGRFEPGRFEPGAPPGDLDLDTAAGGNPGPHTLRATVVPRSITLTWRPPLAVPEGRTIQTTVVYRVDGGIPTPATFQKRTKVGQSSSNSLTDFKVVKGKTYTYWAQSETDIGTQTGISNFVTVVAE
jgi:hypothetical protein